MSRLPGFHPVAWAAWAAAGLAVILAIDNPFATMVVLAAVAVVTAGFREEGPEGRGAMFFVRVGLAVIALRVTLFGLTGRAGETTLVTLPEVSLPRWLGGFSVGGRVTGEVVAHEVAAGLEIAAVLVVFGAFLSIVATHRLMRLMPRFLFEAGLVIGIAVAFVPTLLRTATEVRDAQRSRGHRFRGPRSMRALVVPVVAGAVERSMDLAASMESRGYGRGAVVRSRAPAAALCGLLALTAGGSLLLFGRGSWTVGVVLSAGGAGALTMALRALGRGSPRTRHRPERMEVWDLVAVATAVVTAVGAFMVGGIEAASWSAQPAVSLPEADPRVIAIATLISAPAAIASVRAARLRHAEVGIPAPVEVRA